MQEALKAAELTAQFGGESPCNLTLTWNRFLHHESEGLVFRSI
jgi:hypothetical protein